MEKLEGVLAEVQKEIDAGNFVKARELLEKVKLSSEQKNDVWGAIYKILDTNSVRGEVGQLNDLMLAVSEVFRN